MSFNGIKTPTKPKEKGKWQVPLVMTEKGHMSYVLEGEIKDRFIEKFRKHSNRRIMKWFGISFSTMQRFKRELGLEKDEEAIRKEQVRDTKRICEANGYYDSLRGKPVSDACKEAYSKKRATGWHPMDETKKNKRRYNALMKKRSESRKAMLRTEKMRVMAGMKPHSNMSDAHVGLVRPFNSKETSRRTNALKKGYILGDIRTERYVIFYDQDTRRSARFERNCIAEGFHIEQLT